MSKKISLLAVLMMALMVLFAVSCEGPAGPAGADGAVGPMGPSGVDAQVTCLACHNNDMLVDNQLELARSQHGNGLLAVDYAGGRASCAQCHSHQGFVEWATTGEVSADIATPTAWECSTCHGLHRTFTETLEDSVDYALRKTDAVPGYYDATLMLDVNPSSNLCVNCHQARTSYTNMITTAGDSAKITSTHAGPHHGPQANLLLGINGSVAGTPFADHMAQGCVGCHMYETTGDETNINGGHTFWPAAEKCNSCHSGPDVVFPGRSLTDDFEHAPYYDYKGFQSDMADKMEMLADLLVEAGVFDSTHTVIPATYSIAQYNAFWNYTYINEDRSHGVHNPYYTETLLDAAITGLGGTP